MDLGQNDLLPLITMTCFFQYILNKCCAIEKRLNLMCSIIELNQRIGFNWVGNQTKSNQTSCGGEFDCNLELIELNKKRQKFTLNTTSQAGVTQTGVMFTLDLNSVMTPTCNPYVVTRHNYGHNTLRSKGLIQSRSYLA